MKCSNGPKADPGEERACDVICELWWNWIRKKVYWRGNPMRNPNSPFQLPFLLLQVTEQIAVRGRAARYNSIEIGLRLEVVLSTINNNSTGHRWLSSRSLRSLAYRNIRLLLFSRAAGGGARLGKRNVGCQLKLVELVLRLLRMPKWGEGEIKIIVIWYRLYNINTWTQKNSSERNTYNYSRTNPTLNIILPNYLNYPCSLAPCPLKTSTGTFPDW